MGSWHDSCIALNLYTLLCDTVPEGYYLVADTAFPWGTAQVAGRIWSAMKEGEHYSADPEEQAYEVAFSQDLLSYRQTAEWGNRFMQGSFGRLCVPLPANQHELHGMILETVAWLSNAQTRMVGINQIQTVYESIWRQGEQDLVWQGFKTMLFGEQRWCNWVHQFHVVPAWEWEEWCKIKVVSTNYMMVKLQMSHQTNQACGLHAGV
jgi:hypothetical protein